LVGADRAGVAVARSIWNRFPARRDEPGGRQRTRRSEAVQRPGSAGDRAGQCDAPAASTQRVKVNLWRACALTAIVLAGRPLWSQSSQTSTFEVASVRSNHSGDSESASFVQPGGRYTATNVTVRMLMKSAYGVHDNQIIGGPSWINTDRFDITAKAAGYATAAEFRDQ